MSYISNCKDRIDNQIELLLQTIAKENGFLNYEIEKVPGSLKGDGYLGLITSVCVTGKTYSGKEKRLNLIVKSASKADAVRAKAPLASIFEREIYMYNTIIPAFQTFEKGRNLSPFANSAKFYKACMIEKSEALILEHLEINRYSMWEKSIPMEHDHVCLVVTEYARFHAISLAMRDQEPEQFKKLTDSMYDVFVMFLEKGDMFRMYEDQCRKALDSLDPVADKKAWIVFKTFIEDKLRGFLKNLPKRVDNYSVVMHGDCWTNNMMFRYEDKNNPKKPTKMCLIDFQISRLGFPVMDVSYFLYTCGSKEVLNNYKHYLDLYHDNLSGYLQQLGSNPKEIYPYSIFQEQWKKFSKYGLIWSMLINYIMLSNKNEVTDFTEVSESGKSLADAFNYDIINCKEYNDRVRNIILHFVNNGYI